jgi:hypothetical protein
MEYERLLIGGYFAIAAVCVAIGWCSYLWLRRPMRAMLAKLPVPRLEAVLTRAFPPTMLVVALSAFASVAYSSCGMRTYHQIVTDRALILSVQRHQLADTLRYLRVAVLFWATVAAIPLIVTRVNARRSRSG